MSEPAQKCENYEAIFKQNYTLELFVVFKTAYSCCFALRGNIDFPEFLQKKFKTSTTGLGTYYINSGENPTKRVIVRIKWRFTRYKGMSGERFSLLICVKSKYTFAFWACC